MPDTDNQVERGDRVRVQIDAVGTVMHVDRLRVEVCTDDDDQTVFVRRRHLTLIRPPLALHTEIIPGVGPEPPVGTQLVYDDSGEVVQSTGVGWRFLDATLHRGLFRWIELPPIPAHVVWLPDAARQESS